MTTAEKLKLIQTISGLTQTEIAQKLGVTFVAVNRWINTKAQPRRAAVSKINTLLQEITGVVSEIDSLQSMKREYVLHKKAEYSNPLTLILNQPDLRDQFVLSLTYNTNSIEGSTFSEADTSVVLFNNATVANKSLREHLEVSNHQVALQYLFEHVEHERNINEDFVRTLHSKLMNGIREDAGHYRTHAVRIVGTHVPTANAQSIEKRMHEWVGQMRESSSDIFEVLARSHAEFEQIHPFSDGNGRVGRLLMHAAALHAGFPPVVVKTSRRRAYMSALNKAQMKGEYEGLVEYIFDSLIEGYKILDRIVK